MPEKKPKITKGALSWLEHSENGIDAAILIEGAQSEVMALAGHSSHALNVIYYSLIRGAQKETAKPIQNRCTLQSLTKGATELVESLTEENLRRLAPDAWRKTKKTLKKTYKTKKKGIKDVNSTITDIPESILSYDVGGYNVLASVVQKHLNDPRSSEAQKEPIRKLSNALDEIRAGAQTLTSEQLSKLSLASETIGSLLYAAAESMLGEQLITNISSEAPKIILAAKMKKILDGIYQGEKSILSYMMSGTDSRKFILAGIYDGIKTQKEQEKKQRKPNAQKRYDEKRAKRLTLHTHETYFPSFTDILKHKSGWNEWRQAYDIVVESYKKTDEKVDQGMGTLLSKKTAKATSQEELESRRLIKQSKIGKKSLSYYDQIRAVSTASNLWLGANLYRSSRYFGTALKQGAEWLSGDGDSTLAEDQDFHDAAEGMKSVKTEKKETKHHVSKGKYKRKKTKHKGRKR